MVKYLVITSASIFPSQHALNSTPVMAAMTSALNHRGIATPVNSCSADAAIIWSVLWSGRMAANREVYHHYRSQGLPVIIVEVGALQRGHTWRVSVNHVTTQGYYGHLDSLDWDRPRKLGLQLQTPTVQGHHITVALQHPRSLQVEHIHNWNQWIHNTVDSIRAHTDRPIVLRPHPRGRVAIPDIAGVTVSHPRQLPGTYDSFDFDLDCHAVVNINSGPGIQAAIAGVRPIVESSSLAHPVAVGFDQIEQPYSLDRELWFTQICHTEYTVPELQQGLWLDRLEAVL